MNLLLALFLISSANETCFSPQESCDLKLERALSHATKSIDLAIFDINLPELVQVLIKQSTKLKVRVVLDKRQAKGSHSLATELIAAQSSHKGLDVRFGHQRGIQHNKFVILDGRLMETGSYNYTWHASHANAENQIYLRDKPTIKAYQADFEVIWGSSQPISSMLKTVP